MDAALRKSAREAARWCSERLRDGETTASLRSLIAEPPEDPVELAEGDFATRVHDVVRRRRELLGAIELGEFPGRVVWCEWDQSLLEGACEAESHGFFDVADLPPCDTWIGLSADAKLLYAWVPESLLSLAQAGIDVSSTEVLGWDSNEKT